MDRQDPPLPDWRDPSVGGAMIRTALWLASEVGLGNVFTKEDLRAAVPGREQVDRRMRDLRQYGWRIEDYRTDSWLRPKQLRLAEIGVRVWDPTERKTGRPPRRLSGSTRNEVLARDGYRCVHCGASAGDMFPDGGGSNGTVLTVSPLTDLPDEARRSAGSYVTVCQRCNGAHDSALGPFPDTDLLWRRVSELDPVAKKTLLRWMRNDSRDVGNLEVLFSEYRRLPPIAREALQRRLAEMISDRV
jgi:hypothetical protein